MNVTTRDKSDAISAVTAAGPNDQRRGAQRHAHPYGSFFAAGVLATVAAMAATTAAAALARTVGVEFEIPEGGEVIPLSGLGFVTGVFSLTGVLIALALLRFSTRPAAWFLRTAVALTALSLIPPLISGADTATVTALIALHLVAAAVMIPTLVRLLGDRTT